MENKADTEKVYEKVTTCCLILSSLANDAKDFTYEHVNILVLCLETLALQDKLMTDDLKTKLGDDEAEKELQNLGEHLVGKEDFQFCQDFRLKLFHGNNYYTKEHFRSIIKFSDGGLDEFISTLGKYFRAIKSQLENMKNKVAYVINPFHGCLVSLFDVKTITDDNFGIKFEEKPSDWKPMVEMMLRTAEISGVKEIDDLLKTEEAIYYFSVSMYSILEKLFKSKKAKRNKLIMSFRKERAEYVHEFFKIYKNSNQDLLHNQRRLLMIQFCKSWVGHWYRYFLAVDIYEAINSAEQVTKEYLDDIFSKSTGQLSIHYKIFITVSKYSEKTEIEDHMTNYFRLMPIIDSEEAIAERQDLFVDQSGYDKRKIYEEFMMLKKMHNIIDTTKYKIYRDDLETKLKRKGIPKEKFCEMEKSIIGAKKLDNKDFKMVKKLICLIENYCGRNETSRSIINKIPDYRKISVYTKRKCTLTNLHEKVVDMFCGTDMKDVTFSNVESAFKDPKLLDLLDLMLNSDALQKEKKFDDALSIEGADFIAPYIARMLLIVDKPCSDDFVGRIIRSLLKDLESTVSTESLRTLLNHYKGKQKRTHELIATKIFDYADNSDDLQTQSLSRIFINHQDSEQDILSPATKLPISKKPSCRFDLDFNCIKGLITLCKTNKTLSKESRSARVEIIFKLVVAAIKKVYFRNENKINAMEFLKDFITKKDSSFHLIAVNSSIRMDTICLCATLAAKVNKMQKDKSGQNLTPFVKMAEEFRKFLNPFEIVTSKQFENLYSCAFHASVLEGNHFLALELYRVLLDSILFEFGLIWHKCLLQIRPRTIFLPHNCYRLEEYSNPKWKIAHCRQFHFVHYSEIAIDPDSCYPFLGQDVFSSIFSTSEYKSNLKLGKHGDLIKTLMNIAYECGEIAKLNKKEVQIKWQYTEAAIGLYRNSHKLDISQGNTMGTKILYPMATLCCLHARKNHNQREDQIRYMKKAADYSKQIKKICEDKYLPNHPAVEKSSTRLEEIETFLTKLRTENKHRHRSGSEKLKQY